MTVESRNENAFSEDDIRLLSILSLQVAVGMRNARMYAEIEKLAITDPLTGLSITVISTSAWDPNWPARSATTIPFRSS